VLTEEGARHRLQHMTILVCEDHSGSITGTIGYQREPSGIGHLRGMAVRPSAQATGVAGRLLAAAEHGLRTAGCRRITLDTTRPLTRAIAFYERHGYTPTGTISDFYGMELVEYERSL
jgi:GNAT superfamily N-acetyltransferase